MQVFKVVDGPSRETSRKTFWIPGVQKEIDAGMQCASEGLCSSAWFHCYEDLRQLALFNRGIHTGGYQQPRVFKAEADGFIKQEFDKMGCTKLTLKREIEWPKLNLTKAFFMALRLYLKYAEAEKISKTEVFFDWANEVLDENGLNSDIYYRAGEVNDHGLEDFEQYLISAIRCCYDSDNEDWNDYDGAINNISHAIHIILEYDDVKEANSESGFTFTAFMDECDVHVIIPVVVPTEVFKVFKVVEGKNGRLETQNNMDWELGVPNVIEDEFINPDEELCTCAWLHCYKDLRQMALFNKPCHGCYVTPRVFDAEATGFIRHSNAQDKMGCTSLTLKREIEWPKLDPVKVLIAAIKLVDLYFEKSNFVGGAQEFSAWSKKVVEAGELTPDLVKRAKQGFNYSMRPFECYIADAVINGYSPDGITNYNVVIHYLGSGINKIMEYTSGSSFEDQMPDLMTFLDECDVQVLNYEPEKTMKLYKVTESDMTTHESTIWKLGVPREIPDDLQNEIYGLCSNHWLHAYEDLRQVALFNRACHSNFRRPLVFEAEGAGLFKMSNTFDKMGCTRLTLMKEVPWPELDIMRTAFMVIKLHAFKNEKAGNVSCYGSYVAWADKVLSAGSVTEELAGEVNDFCMRVSGGSVEGYIIDAVMCSKDQMHSIQRLGVAASSILNEISECSRIGDEEFNFFKFMDDCGVVVL